MRYVYETDAYGPDPIRDLYWSTTVPPVSLPTLHGSQKTDVAVMVLDLRMSAAYHLGQAGVDVTVMDAGIPCSAQQDVMGDSAVWAAGEFQTHV